MIYYSPSHAGFFHDEVHGPRKLLVDDPAWVAPEAVEGESAQEPPLIEIDNPACMIPGDAVEITEQDHADLMAAQAAGKRIVPDADGKPVAQDPPPPTDDELAARERAWRDRELASTDWTQARDVPDALAAKWAPYRQALRDLPQQAGFPRTVTRPTRPA